MQWISSKTNTVRVLSPKQPLRNFSVFRVLNGLRPHLYYFCNLKIKPKTNLGQYKVKKHPCICISWLLG